MNEISATEYKNLPKKHQIVVPKSLESTVEDLPQEGHLEIIMTEKLLTEKKCGFLGSTGWEKPSCPAVSRARQIQAHIVRCNLFRYP